MLPTYHCSTSANLLRIRPPCACRSIFAWQRRRRRRRRRRQHAPCSYAAASRRYLTAPQYRRLQLLLHSNRMSWRRRRQGCAAQAGRRMVRAPSAACLGSSASKTPHRSDLVIHSAKYREAMCRGLCSEQQSAFMSAGERMKRVESHSSFLKALSSPAKRLDRDRVGSEYAQRFRARPCHGDGSGGASDDELQRTEKPSRTNLMVNRILATRRIVCERNRQRQQEERERIERMLRGFERRWRVQIADARAKHSIRIQDHTRQPQQQQQQQPLCQPNLPRSWSRRPREDWHCYRRRIEVRL